MIILTALVTGRRLTFPNQQGVVCIGGSSAIYIVKGINAADKLVTAPIGHSYNIFANLKRRNQLGQISTIGHSYLDSSGISLTCVISGFNHSLANLALNLERGQAGTHLVLNGVDFNSLAVLSGNGHGVVTAAVNGSSVGISGNKASIRQGGGGGSKLGHDSDGVGADLVLSQVVTQAGKLLDGGVVAQHLLHHGDDQGILGDDRLIVLLLGHTELHVQSVGFAVGSGSLIFQIDRIASRVLVLLADKGDLSALRRACGSASTESYDSSAICRKVGLNGVHLLIQVGVHAVDGDDGVFPKLTLGSGSTERNHRDD